jgi:hypothetical protein
LVFGVFEAPLHVLHGGLVQMGLRKMGLVVERNRMKVTEEEANLRLFTDNSLMKKHQQKAYMHGNRRSTF